MTMCCHGDDFIAEGPPQSMQQLSGQMRQKFDCKQFPWVGLGFTDSGDFLKRLVGWSSELGAFTWQGDPRLIEQAAALLGIDVRGCKGAPTPGSRATGSGMKEGPELLDESGRRLVYQAGGLCTYICLDRPDGAYAAKGIMSEASSATHTPTMPSSMGAFTAP